MIVPKAVVTFSSGIGSWAAAKRYAEEHGTQGLVLLFADTKKEDEDNYRFLHEAAANVGGRLEIIADGRTPWQVMRDERMIGNTRFDPCSKILKRQLLDRWRNEYCDKATTTIIIGISWDEEHRLDRLRERNPGWRYIAPMCSAPYLTKPDMLSWARKEGLRPPRLYDLGFAHSNCGGFCVKAGQAQFKLLLKTFPERYAEHEAEEESLREVLGDYSILRDRRGGGTRPLTLRELRLRIEAGAPIDEFDFGGCGCAL